MSSNATRATVGIIGIGIIAVLILLFRARHHEQPASVSHSAPEAASTSTAPTQVADQSAEIQNLKGRLAEEMRARRRTEAETAALREKTAPLQTNAVASLVKSEELGKRAGAFLPAMGELQALTARDSNTLSPEEKRRLLELQREHAKFLGALPEITAYQDKPDDYGRFFRNMLQQAAGLTDPQAAQVEDFMRQRATEMNQLELNAGKEPTDPKLEEAWEERRDQFNEQTANGLKAILPPGAAEKAGLGPELMEFLEMDFDKISPKTAERKAQ